MNLFDNTYVNRPCKCKTKSLIKINNYVKINYASRTCIQIAKSN